MKTKVPGNSKSIFPEGRMRAHHQFSVSAFWFAVNLLWGALLIIIIPSQMMNISPKNYAWTTGLLLGLGAIPALIIPLLIGPLSDRCMSKWGRRRPYMVTGVMINLVGLAMVWFAGKNLSLGLYFGGYLVVQIGNNISTGAYNGIIPDVVPVEQRGEASGWMAAMSQLGTIAGVASAGVLMKFGYATAAFIVVGTSMIIFLAITALGTREIPRKTTPDRLDLIKFIKNLWIDPRKHPDFSWVWITRALVVMGLWTVQEYMQYYLVDVVGVKPEQKEMTAGIVLVISLICATITGLIGGSISDKIGRKKVVYTANTMIAAACFAFILFHSLNYVYIIAAIFGLGFGAYYSVDWALGCDVLPNKDDAAKDMAVWHISMVLPQSIALPVSGIILSLFGKTITKSPGGEVAHYTQNGYTAIFSLAAFFLLLGAVLIRNVRSVR